MRFVRRIWHYLVGHPLNDIYQLLDDEGLYCNSCGKTAGVGGRL